VAVARLEQAGRHHGQVEAGMEADQAPRVEEDLRLQHKAACQVAQINLRRRRVLPRRNRRASNRGRRALGQPARTTPSSAHLNARQCVRVM